MHICTGRAPQLLLASCLTPEQRELAETLLESGNSLLGVLGDVLDFSKLVSEWWEREEGVQARPAAVTPAGTAGRQDGA